jgi:transcriptional regulator with XRE-family HTH domain
MRTPAQKRPPRPAIYPRGARISELRTARGLTQEQMARDLGTRQPAIARLEAGQHTVSAGMIARLALYFAEQPDCLSAPEPRARAA